MIQLEICVAQNTCKPQITWKLIYIAGLGNIDYDNDICSDDDDDCDSVRQQLRTRFHILIEGRLSSVICAGQRLFV